MMSFATDTATLRESLKGMKLSLEEERLPLEALWKDIRLNIEPTLGKALIEGNRAHVAAQRDDDKIINSEPRLLLRRLAAGLQSGITNPANQWFRLSAGDPKVGKTQAVRAWLSYATEAIHQQFQRSNVYKALNELYMHLGLFGTACGLMTDNAGTPFLNILDEGAYWIEENIYGQVDVCMFRLEMTPKQLMEEFGKEWLPERMRTGTERKTILCMVFPRERFDVAIDERDVVAEMPFVSVYFIEHQAVDTDDGIIGIRGHWANPIVAPRWYPGVNAYGVGCGHVALADCKELQSMELDRLRLTKTVVDPPLLVPSSMKGMKVRSGPGGITYYDQMSASGKAPVTPLYDLRFDASAVDQSVIAVTGRIQRLFYADLFAMLMGLVHQKSNMTATEVLELAAEKVSLLGPVLTQLDTDLLDPLVNGVWALTVNGVAMERFEELGAPPRGLMETGMKVDYISSLHMEQQSMARMQSVNSLMQAVGPIMQLDPSALDKIDTDRAVDVIAESLFEHGIVRDSKMVEKIRMQRAQAKQQQQEMEQALAAGKASRDSAAAVRDETAAARDEVAMEAEREQM